MLKKQQTSHQGSFEDVFIVRLDNEKGQDVSEQRENRRVRMTKRLMKDALMELLEQEELVDISVTAICEAADVNRSTFYKYYRDPVDLLRDLEQDYLDQIPIPPSDFELWDEEQLLVETTTFFDFVRQNERAFRVLLGDSTSNGFAARLIDFLCIKYARPDESDVAAHFVNLYIANGTVGMLREWVNSGFPVSSRTIAEMMYFFSVKVSQ